MRTLAACLSLSLLIHSSAALAQDPEAQAEFDRVASQMTKLATRNAWTGVERQYQLLLETGLPLGAGEHFLGAEAARNLGNADAAHERLLLANELESTEAIIDYLWEIDNNYGKVELTGEPGVALEIAVMPFAPTQAAAIEFARAQLAETGSFSGRLPGGEYVFGGMPLQVVPLGESVSLSLLPEEGEPSNKQKARDAAKEPQRPPPAQPIDGSGGTEEPKATKPTKPPESVSQDGPTLIGLGVGAGSPYGLFGVGAALRPTARQAIQVGVGFDPLGSGAGWSVAGRQRLGEPGLFYAEVGYGAIEFRKEGAPGAGPFVAGGMELAQRGLLIDGTFGVGTTMGESGDRVFKPIFGLAVGGNIGPNR